MWEDMTILRGREHSATKISITFFVGNEVLNIFHLTILFFFFLEKTIFFKITAISNSRGHDHFYKKGALNERNTNITFSVGNGVLNTVFKYFLQKYPYWLNES